VAIFIVLVVVLIVGQTWVDWRDTQRKSTVPSWARGVALGGLFAIGLTAVTSFASAAYEATLSGWNARLSAHLFWPETVFVILAIGVIVIALRKKRLGVVFALAGLLAAAIALSLVYFA
jgi:hypothetical protein